MENRRERERERVELVKIVEGGQPSRSMTHNNKKQKKRRRRRRE